MVDDLLSAASNTGARVVLHPVMGHLNAQQAFEEHQRRDAASPGLPICIMGNV